MAKHSKSEQNNAESSKEPPPVGPTDHGGKGGMATREVAPEISEPESDTSSD